MENTFILLVSYQGIWCSCLVLQQTITLTSHSVWELGKVPTFLSLSLAGYLSSLTHRDLFPVLSFSKEALTPKDSPSFLLKFFISL